MVVLGGTELKILVYLPGFSPEDGSINQEYYKRQIVRTACMLEMPPPGRNVIVDVGGIQTERRLHQERGGRPLLGLPWLDNIGFSTCETIQRTGYERLNGHLPIALAEPGKIREVVTPPATANSYAASCVLIPSIERSQETIGPWSEFVSSAPPSNGDAPTPICE